MAPSATSSAAVEGLAQQATKHINAGNAPKTRDTNVYSGVQGLNASALIFTRNTQPRPIPDTSELENMNATTDHMITCTWTSSTGWQTPHLLPYGPLSLLPTASVLHYATECFEGMKCYRGHDGRIRLFRPDQNCIRMRSSAARISLPDFDPEQLQQLISALVSVEGEKWLPKSEPATFLYLRPTLIGSESTLSLRGPKEALLYIVALRFPTLDGPQEVTSSPNAVSLGNEVAAAQGLKLLASSEGMVRAWPGGFGFAKVGANYGPSFLANVEAKERGYDQILWLFGPQDEVTEAGASNFFVVWVTRDGTLQLVTAPLRDQVILNGITRRSVLELARTRLQPPVGGVDPLEVVERKFSMNDVEEAVGEGRLVEAFVCGTAYFITAVSHIHYRGKDLDIPTSKANGGSGGTYAGTFKTWLTDIIYGEERHEWGVIVEENE
ncbi:MAG: hypothetical protein Q9186_001189 [Xanthomendoza sp. 1 TL-2023]